MVFSKEAKGDMFIYLYFYYLHVCLGDARLQVTSYIHAYTHD